MQKIVAIVSQDDHLIKIMERVKERCDHFEQRKEFLRKQLEDLTEQAHKEICPIIEEVQNYLEAEGKMPAEFNRHTHHTHWEEALGVIMVCDGDHSNNGGGGNDGLPKGLLDILKRLR